MVIPGTKNLRGTFKIYQPGREAFKIYQPGREVQITGNVVDFDMKEQMAVVVKFKPTPEGAVSPLKLCGSNGSPLLSTYIKKGARDVASTLQAKGKDKAGADNNSLDSSSSSSKDKGEPQATPPKKARGRPRKDILKAAAKRMKRA
ncbi:hypothetical protein PCANC_11931 [Puccinia coronata f. sp. avenae]|uniref:Uncharacterized protein n=1 Tax=Puccinia coronata f. sp. avenae TaxID=200324 RepID=A0A2N5T384_9BASI|nr:hypothetical protein PCANC_11931 [Puccinia coronata f. sp. avenae]